jgi:hypothetical protein
MASEEDYGGVRLGNSSNKPVELWAGSNTIFRFDSDGSLTLPGDIKSESAINIDVNLTDSTLRRWRFGEDGDLTFPDNTVQTTAFTGTGDITFNGRTISASSGTGSDFIKIDDDLTIAGNDLNLSASNGESRIYFYNGTNVAAGAQLTIQTVSTNDPATNLAMVLSSDHKSSYPK